MDQKPGKFYIMAVTCIISGIAFLSILREPVPPPYNIELYLWCNGPVLKKLRDAGLINRMDQTVQEKINIFKQFASVYIFSRTLIKSCKCLHQVHVDIKSFSVASLASRTTECPVTMEHFPVTSIH